MYIGGKHKHPEPLGQTCLPKWVQACSGHNEPGGDGHHGQEGPGGAGQQSDGPSRGKCIQQTCGMVGFYQPSHELLHCTFKRVDFAALGHPSPIYVNMVREPVERLVSWFYYIRAAWSVETIEKVVKWSKGTSWIESRPSPITLFLHLPGSGKPSTPVLQIQTTWSVNILR